MKSVVVVALLLACFPLFPSTIERHDLNSAAVAGNKVAIPSLRHFEVYLPTGYETGTDRYPVLYYLPSFGGSAAALTYKKPLDSAIKQGILPPAIFVFVDSTEGFMFLNSSLFGKWEDFMNLEVVPFIDKTYRAIPDPKKRGLIGHSLGGYSALMLTFLHPDVWANVGVNDPGTPDMWFPISDESDVQGLGKEALDYFNSDRKAFGAINQGWISVASLSDESFLDKAASHGISRDEAVGAIFLLQQAASFSPNPDSALLVDLPVAPDGEWVQEIRNKWSEYDFTNPKTLAKHSDAMKKLLSIAIVVPEATEESGRTVNLIFIDRLQKAGIPLTRLDMPGGHVTDTIERFIVLADQLLKSMQRAK